ncbi:MAG: molybdenum cofactor guanylyltransferase, partial [Aestuariivirga sp.]
RGCHFYPTTAHLSARAMRVLGCIIAGGKSTRMGRDKALIEWRGKALILHVIDRLEPQVDRLVINANSAHLDLGFQVISDRIDTGTPLAGLHAALHFASVNGFDAVITAPCDSPLLPHDLRTRLQGPNAAIAASAGQAHYLTGFWPVAVLSQFIAHKFSRVADFVAATQARQVEWQVEGHDPFVNLNTPEDLVALSEKT